MEEPTTRLVERDVQEDPFGWQGASSSPSFKDVLDHVSGSVLQVLQPKTKSMPIFNDGFISPMLTPLTETSSWVGKVLSMIVLLSLSVTV